MAGLDNQESPFLSASQLPATRGGNTFAYPPKGIISDARESNYAHQPKLSSTPNHASVSSKLIPNVDEPYTKSNGYLGDISSNNYVSESSTNNKNEDIFKKKGVYFGDSVLDNRHVTGMSAKDPTMNVDVEFDKKSSNQNKRDELYERIRQETSSAFPHTTEKETAKSEKKDLTSTPKTDEEVRQTWRQKLEDGNKSKEDDSQHETKDSVWGRGLSEENVHDISEIDSMSPKKSDSKGRGEKVATREGSRLSDYNYSMDSFELSERGEKIHFDGDLQDLDTYESSPSPPAQPVDSDEF